MLSALQERAVLLFFSLPESEGFAVAGGSALVLAGLVNRSTKDLDLFSSGSEVVRPAAHALAARARAAGLECSILRDFETFVRMELSDGDDSTLIDLAADFRLFDVRPSRLGPLLAPEELAADKTLALFGRAAPRDFVDVYVLAERFGIDTMLSWAREKDRGFDDLIFAEMLGRIAGIPRAEFELSDDDYALLDDFFAECRATLIERSLKRPEARGET